MAYWVYGWWCWCWVLMMDFFKLGVCFQVSLFLSGCRTSIMSSRIGISTKFPFRTIIGWLLNSKQWLRYDWLVLWMVVLLLGADDGLLQTRFVFAGTFLPLWLPYELDGRIGVSTKFMFRTKINTFKLPLVEEIWIFKNYHFRSSVWLYSWSVSCRTIISSAFSTFQYHILYHTASVLNDRASFFTNELVTWPILYPSIYPSEGFYLFSL